ncbi:hypothetical protein GOP47_0001392 [Adiantum capillus-veneris]|uniref:Gamma-glutamylcyclotransferase n=1 Tax=Adiantum capillus-veneris TaxID=13818 RepID=A0A9D4V8U8_ADICA|nr:hypothetical protein GOP47_0001392 [Adiantum capillus-veneris]
MVMWIFGYASLMWRAGFDYDERIVGFIRGYRRVFHLACFEHRGTHDLPARVATLEPEEDAICWGAAFCIKDTEAAEKAMLYLHERESEYDTVGHVQFYTEESYDCPLVPEALVFMSTTDKQTNRFYLGPAPKDEIAMQIATATGPNGPNCDYLFRLVEALREIGHEDEEIVELARAVRRMLSKCKTRANQANLSASPRNLFASQSLVATQPHSMLPAAVQGVPGPLSHSPRLLKSQAR